MQGTRVRGQWTPAHTVALVVVQLLGLWIAFQAFFVAVFATPVVSVWGEPNDVWTRLQGVAAVIAGSIGLGSGLFYVALVRRERAWLTAAAAISLISSTVTLLVLARGR